MPNVTRIVSTGPDERLVTTSAGQVLAVPGDWELVPPGDAALTRRVKNTGPSWTVQQRKGRRVFSLGVWASAERITTIRAELAKERSTETHAKRRAADAKRRARQQQEYVDDFRGAVLAFLDFAPRHATMAARIADAVTAHATPVGSGTVARTSRIPLEQRAESAVIAWLRHRTTAYDNMAIPRVRGQRREVRRQLAASSRRLLDNYRHDVPANADCPLRAALG